MDLTWAQDQLPILSGVVLASLSQLGFLASVVLSCLLLSPPHPLTQGSLGRFGGAESPLRRVRPPGRGQFHAAPLESWGSPGVWGKYPVGSAVASVMLASLPPQQRRKHRGFIKAWTANAPRPRVLRTQMLSF